MKWKSILDRPTKIRKKFLVVDQNGGNMNVAMIRDDGGWSFECYCHKLELFCDGDCCVDCSQNLKNPPLFYLDRPVKECAQ
jgi:hypothetical protein